MKLKQLMLATICTACASALVGCSVPSTGETVANAPTNNSETPVATSTDLISLPPTAVYITLPSNCELTIGEMKTAIEGYAEAMNKRMPKGGYVTVTFDEVSDDENFEKYSAADKDYLAGVMDLDSSNLAYPNFIRDIDSTVRLRASRGEEEEFEDNDILMEFDSVKKCFAYLYSRKQIDINGNVTSFAYGMSGSGLIGDRTSRQQETETNSDIQSAGILQDARDAVAAARDNAVNAANVTDDAPASEG